MARRGIMAHFRQRTGALFRLCGQMLGTKIVLNLKKTKLCTMKVADFVKINAETMKLLSRLDIKTSDFKYNDIFARPPLYI